MRNQVSVSFQILKLLQDKGRGHWQLLHMQQNGDYFGKNLNIFNFLVSSLWCISGVQMLPDVQWLFFCIGVTINCCLPTYWGAAGSWTVCSVWGALWCWLSAPWVVGHKAPFMCVRVPPCNSGSSVFVCVSRGSAVRWALLHSTKEHLPSGAHGSLHCQEMSGKYARHKITSYILFCPIPWTRIHLVAT